MRINETKIRINLKLTEANLCRNQTFEKSFRLKGIFFLLISVLGSLSSELDKAKIYSLNYFLRAYGFGKSDASNNVTDKQISFLRSKFFLSVYDFHRKLENNDIELIKNAQLDILSLQYKSFFGVLKNLYIGNDDHMLVDLFSNQEFENEILSRISFNDILMTISLEKFIAVPEYFEYELKDALNIVNQTLKYPLCDSELRSLKDLILVYPTTGIISNQERQLKEFGKNVFKTLNNFFALKCRILKLKHRIPLSKKLEDGIIYYVYTPYDLERTNSVSVTLDDHSEDFKISTLSINIGRYDEALKMMQIVNELLDLSQLKNLNIQFSERWYQGRRDSHEIGSVFCSIIKKATKLEDLVLDNGSDRLLSEISSDLADILEKLNNLHSLSLLCPIESTENFNRILLALKDKPIIKRLEIGNNSNLFSINNEQLDPSTCEVLSFFRGKIETLVLSYNRLSVKSAELIASALSCNASDDIIKFESTQPLLTHSKSAPFGIKKIVLSEYSYSEIDTNTIIFLNQFSSLEEVDLKFEYKDYNQMQFEKLLNYLENHSYSHKFKVFDNGFLDKVNTSNVLKFCQRDDILDLKHIKIDKETFTKSFPEINFEDFKNIKKLCLRCVNVHDSILIALLEGLKSFAIEEIDLSNNYNQLRWLEPQDFSLLGQLVSEFPNLHSLDLSNNYFEGINKYLFKKFLLKAVSGRVFNYLNISSNPLELVDKSSIDFYLNLFSTLISAEDLRFNLLLSGVDINDLLPVLERVSSCDRFKKVSLTIEFQSEYTQDDCLILAKKISMMQNLSNLFLKHDDMNVLSKMFEIISINNNFRLLKEVSLFNSQKYAYYRGLPSTPFFFLPFENYFAIMTSLKKLHYLKDIEIKTDDGLLIKIN